MNLSENLVFFSPRSRRQNKALGEAEGGTPGTIRICCANPRSGRQLFVIRHFVIIETANGRRPLRRLDMRLQHIPGVTR
jgi:hypothetical protein